MTADREEFRAGVRAFVDEVVAPAADAWDREGRIPPAVLDEVAARGWWDTTGLDRVSHGLLHGEIGRGCSSLRSLITVPDRVRYAIGRAGHDGQRERWLPALADGSVLGAFALSEPDAESDAAAIRTEAVREGDGWSLAGTKTWITAGRIAGLFLVFAKAGGRHAAFLVPRAAPGLRVEPNDDVTGMRAGMLATLGLSRRSPVSRYLRDARAMEIVEGSTEILQVLLANYALRDGDAHG